MAAKRVMHLWRDGIRHPGQGGLRRTLAVLAVLFLLTSTWSAAADTDPHRQDEIMATQISRVLPAVVGILAEVGAEVTVRCGPGDVRTVQADPERETGTGFIIHPAGWIATNHHVVLPVQKPDEGYATKFLTQVATDTCLKKLPNKAQRDARLKALLADPVNRRGVKVTKQLKVFLGTGTAEHPYLATIRAFSRHIDLDQLPKDGSRPEPPMGDAALLKIDGQNLPAVRLAPSLRAGILLGQQLFITGYPGVVLWHPFLSPKERLEPSVTFGRASAFRLDINERTILQTDAAISWGNSGGPAFNLRDEVIGLATFTSTSFTGDQVIQGFNFLVPIDTIHALAAQVSLTPSAESPFNKEWDQTIDAALEGKYQQALAHGEAANQIVPDLADVQRGMAWIRSRMAGRP